MVDFGGRRFGNARALHLRSRQPEDGKNRKPSWVMRCDCGNYYLRNHSGLVAIPSGAPIEECPICTRTRAAMNGKKGERALRHAIRMARERP